MTGRHAEVMRRVHDAVLETPGSLDSATRLAVATGRDVPAELEAYADKVARHAYRVTDADTAALRKAGYSDNAIFEITVAVALGAGLLRRDVGIAAIEGAR
jgi:alkylhydroperoxidase family enzyme